MKNSSTFKILTVLFLTIAILFGFSQVGLAAEESLLRRSFRTVTNVLPGGSLINAGVDYFTGGKSASTGGTKEPVCPPGTTLDQATSKCRTLENAVKVTDGQVSYRCDNGTPYYRAADGSVKPIPGTSLPDPQSSQLIGCMINPTNFTSLENIPTAVTQELQGYQLAVPIPCQPGVGGDCPELLSGDPQLLSRYIARIYQFALMIAGLVAFGSIVFGALQYVLSAGGVSTQEEARGRITQAVVGLILLLGATVILGTVNPDLLNIRNPEAPPVNIDEIIQRAQVAPGAGGQSQTIAGDTRGAGGVPLCSAGTYDKTSITIGGREQLEEFTCKKCVLGAEFTGPNKCECQSGFSFYAPDGWCIANTSCINQGGKVEGGQCVVQVFQQSEACTSKGGVCKQTGSSACLGGRFEAGICPGPANIQCCIQ